MAEGEVKTERRTIEMSIWFILLLVVVIIAGTMVIALKGEIRGLKEELASRDQKIEQLSKKNDTNTSLILDLVKSQVDNANDKQAFIDNLREALNQKEQELNGILNPTEGVSGEAIQ